VAKTKITQLHLAMNSNDVGEMRKLLAGGRLKIDAMGKDDLHPLLTTGCGSRWVTEETLLAILSHAPDVNKRGTKDVTALHEAAMWGRSVAFLTKLLDAGADVNAVDHDGWTPVMGAVHHAHEDTAKLLFDRGARADAMTLDGRSLLDLADTAIRGERDAPAKDRAKMRKLVERKLGGKKPVPIAVPPAPPLPTKLPKELARFLAADPNQHDWKMSPLLTGQIAHRCFFFAKGKVYGQDAEPVRARLALELRQRIGEDIVPHIVPLAGLILAKKFAGWVLVDLRKVKKDGTCPLFRLGWNQLEPVAPSIAKFVASLS
jgi:hypothetical protein